jgi:hypothetical protein
VSDLAVPGLAYAYANYGRWVVDCPRPWCTNAMQVWRGQDGFECQGRDACGWSSPIVWPPDPDAIETILAARPTSTVRNWAVGGTLAELVEENAVHGFLPKQWADPALTGSPHPKIIETVNEVVVGGTILPAVEARRAQHALDR